MQYSPFGWALRSVLGFVHTKHIPFLLSTAFGRLLLLLLLWATAALSTSSSSVISLSAFAGIRNLSGLFLVRGFAGFGGLPTFFLRVLELTPLSGEELPAPGFVSALNLSL